MNGKARLVVAPSSLVPLFLLTILTHPVEGSSLHSFETPTSAGAPLSPAGRPLFYPSSAVHLQASEKLFSVERLSLLLILRRVLAPLLQYH